MKKFLEVLMDEQGNMTLHSDFDFSKMGEPGKEKEVEQLLRKSMECLIRTVWKENDQNGSKAIRILSMAEVASCADPYMQAEELWGSLMFSYLPHYEKFCEKLKKPYGFDPSLVNRPVSFVNPCVSGFMSGKGVS